MSNERPPVLLSEALHPGHRDGPDPDQLERLAARFADGGCCGKRPTLTLADLKAAGLTPIPTVFVSSLGQIIPRTGWRAMCVYVYEMLIKKPFPVPEKGEEWGDVVAAAIKEKLDAQSR